MNEEKKDISIFLRPTYTIESDHPDIVDCALDVTGGCRNNTEKAIKLFYYVRDSIHYNIFMISVFEEDFMASRVLTWGKGYCVQKAVLLTALARAAGIPTGLVFASIQNHRVPEHLIKITGSNVFPRHGYNRFYLNGRWLSAAATFDKKVCEKNGLPTVEFDGTSDAILPEKDLSGNPYIDYLEKFPMHADLPFKWIYDAISKRVGPDKRPSFAREG